MPRLLHIATSQNDGGIEHYAVQIAASLAASGADIWFACMPGKIISRQCAASGVRTVPLTVRNSGDVQAAWQLSQLIAGKRIDLVHVHSRRDYVPALMAVILARLRGCKVRLLLHAHLVRPLGDLRRLTGSLVLNHADAVVAVSQTVKQHLQATHRLPDHFVRVLHNGIFPERFALPETLQAQEWRSRLRREWQVPEDTLVITAIGRLDAKGQWRLLQAIPGLGKHVCDIRVVLVGSEGSHGEMQRLQDIAKSAGIADYVVFTGPQEDIPGVLAASDILVHLPNDEAFGLALAEAMAAGLPTVATDIGGCREVVVHEETGLLVTPGDEAALANALLRLAAPGAARLRAQYGAAGRARAEDTFSFQAQMDRLKAIYCELCPTSLPLRI